ncbi:fec operon regulator FecR [Achromobacter xylosoxidans]|uniref:FecR family protein n=1 Tax=Alcaligenes xylosoxydans xylosoxydans TaxID=85698 RepID=UPI0006C22240|nr:FecR domain-containing protein [Achromobacter xylosoxidans]CUI29553.1 fec operon regulator FecR [Achromobacter xylosoxidans]
MSADSVKAALRTLDSFLAYYTTPINILPVTQGQGGTSLGLYGTATGLIQVGVGVVQMIGKSVLMPVNAGATVLSLSSSVLNMRKTFTDTAPGTIKVSDFAAAMSSVVSLVGIAAAAAAVPAALPLAATIAVTSAVISSALTGARARQARRRALKLLAFSGAGLASGATGWLAYAEAPWQRLLADASSGAGERRALLLDDGTRLVLNADTAVRTRMDALARTVTLMRGEILVETGADAGLAARREFWVDTPAGRLQALGTRFVVRLAGERARVSVLEGSVALHPADAPAMRVVALAGDSRWLARRGVEPAEQAGYAPDAWVDGMVAGRDIRLADLAAELERYTHGRIRCDPAVAELRISGVFHLDRPEQTLRFIEQSLPVRVSRLAGYWIRILPAGA